MVPLRFVSEFFGALVEWDGATQGIGIIRDAAPPTNPSTEETATANLVMAMREDEDDTTAPTAETDDNE
jgi:hypothetical protein